MNINRKFIIILGVSTLLLVTILGLKAYYQERESQTIPTSPEDISFKKTFDKNYPTSLEETISFNKICADVNTIISVQKQEFEPLLCVIVEDKNYATSGKYIFIPTPLRRVSALPQGRYIAVAVNYSDLFRKNNSFSLPEGSFNLCTITKPVLIDPFREELLLKNQININRNIVFSEGEVFCSKFFGLPNEIRNVLISGFIPETDLFGAKIYLVPEDKTINDIFSQESFTNIEDILQPYSLLWSIEKPVI